MGVYFYFYVNSDLIKINIRLDGFPAKMFRTAIGQCTMQSLNFSSIENLKSSNVRAKDLDNFALWGFLLPRA